MSNFETRRLTESFRKESERNSREIMAKYFLDLSKVMLTALAFTALAPWMTDKYAHINYWFVAGGFVGSVVSAALAYRILKKNYKK